MGRMEIEQNKNFIGKKVLKVSCGENHVMAIGDNIVDYASPSVLSISLEDEEEGLKEISELHTPVKKSVTKAKEMTGDGGSKGKKNKKKEEKENLMETKKNFDGKRKELNEISVNEMQNKAKEEFSQGNNRKIKEKEEEDNCKYVELKRINEILNKNVENLNEVLKTYLDEDSKNSNIQFNLLKDESDEICESELEEKVKYLMIRLSTRDHDVACMQLELSKKEALQQALLYKIKFLEESLDAKELEIQNLKNKY